MSIQKAVDYFGNESRLARAIGVKQPTVWAWNKKERRPRSFGACRLKN
ncbi:YdaS family helix-turn-helix protein [Neisseria gonorrhoeae]